MERTSSSGLTLAAPAKINLGLEILRRRSDGFHDINTIFAAVALHDEIVLRPRDDGKITCRVIGEPSLETDERNLCVRAAAMLRQALGMEELHGIDIELMKRIPVGAGLGGGSSDAATVLHGASRLWGIEPDEKLLREIALILGSDVPFFLRAGVAHAMARGELLTPIPVMLPFAVLLVNPRIHVSTPWAYSAVGRTTERPASDLVSALRHGIDHPESLRERVVNDFEPAVFAEYPELQRIEEALYRAGALFALMSGSGSTLFGLFPDLPAATAAAEQFSDCWTAATTFAHAAQLHAPGSVAADIG